MAWNHFSLRAIFAIENSDGSLSCCDHDRLLLVPMFNPIALSDRRTNVRQSKVWRVIEIATHHTLEYVGSTVCLLFALLAFDLFDGSAHLSRLI